MESQLNLAPTEPAHDRTDAASASESATESTTDAAPQAAWPPPRVWLLPAVAGGALFPVLFYDAGIGLNALGWTLVVLGAGLIRRPVQGWTSSVWYSAGAMAFAATCIAWHGSNLATLAWLVSICWFSATVQAPELRRLPLLVALSVQLHSLHLLRAGLASLRATMTEIGRGLGVRQEAVAALLALPVIVLFVLLYRAGSSAFAALTNGLAQLLETWLAQLPEAAPGIILAACFATAWLMAVLFPARTASWLDRQATWGDTQPQPRTPAAGLTTERGDAALATLLFISLNALILVLNLTDIATYWFGLGPARVGKAHLVTEVYEGTGALVFSILLVMGIVLYVFRPGVGRTAAHPRLLALALVWLAQNAVLVVNVAVRDAAYMDQRGLAYKRLLLVCFLILALWGLWTLAQKLLHNRSLLWVLHRNLAAALVLLLAVSTVNWDYQIARYNLRTQPPAEVDYAFLLDMHASVLPLLYERQSSLTDCDHRQQMNRRLTRFQKTYGRLDWRSWSWDRHQAYQALQHAQPLALAPECQSD